MKVHFTPQAIAQAEAAQKWWRRNRRLAPRLFEEELAKALQLLRGAPLAGPPYAHPRRRDVRRLLLPETRYHLYYCVTDGDGVIVLAVWSALRGRGPQL